MGGRGVCAALLVLGGACTDEGPEGGETGDETQSGPTVSSTMDPGSSGPGSGSNTNPGTSSATTDPSGATEDPSTSTAPPETTGDGGSSTDGGDETGVPVGCYDYDAFAPFAVSYRDDVMPILAASCSGCHMNPDASVYYGMGGTSEAEASAIYDLLLNGDPIQAPHLSFIVPFDPLRSYMMAKMEYDDPGGTCSAVVCMEPGCELQAPPAAQLPENELAIMRSWIMNGALDD